MKNEVYNYLINYFDEMSNKKKEIEKSNQLFLTADRLNKSRKITIEDKDALVNDICSAMEYAISVISNCPYVEIHLRKIIRNSSPRKRKQTKSVPQLSPAIGFQYAEDEYLEDNEQDRY